MLPALAQLFRKKSNPTRYAEEPWEKLEEEVAKAIADEAYTTRSRTMGSTSLASNPRSVAASPTGHRFKNVKL